MTTPDDVRAIVDERLVHHGLDRAYERTLAAAGNAGHALQLARELCRRAGMTDAEIEAIEGR